VKEVDGYGLSDQIGSINKKATKGWNTKDHLGNGTVQPWTVHSYSAYYSALLVATISTLVREAATTGRPAPPTMVFSAVLFDTCSSLLAALPTLSKLASLLPSTARITTTLDDGTPTDHSLPSFLLTLNQVASTWLGPLDRATSALCRMLIALLTGTAVVPLMAKQRNGTDAAQADEHWLRVLQSACDDASFLLSHLASSPAHALARVPLTTAICSLTTVTRALLNRIAGTLSQSLSQGGTADAATSLRLSLARLAGHPSLPLSGLISASASGGKVLSLFLVRQGVDGSAMVRDEVQLFHSSDRAGEGRGRLVVLSSAVAAATTASPRALPVDLWHDTLLPLITRILARSPGQPELLAVASLAAAAVARDKAVGDDGLSMRLWPIVLGFSLSHWTSEDHGIRGHLPSLLTPFLATSYPSLATTAGDMLRRRRDAASAATRLSLLSFILTKVPLATALSLTTDEQSTGDSFVQLVIEVLNGLGVLSTRGAANEALRALLAGLRKADEATARDLTPLLLRSLLAHSRTASASLHSQAQNVDVSLGAMERTIEQVGEAEVLTMVRHSDSDGKSSLTLLRVLAAVRRTCASADLLTLLSTLPASSLTALTVAASSPFPLYRSLALATAVGARATPITLDPPTTTEQPNGDELTRSSPFVPATSSLVLSDPATSSLSLSLSIILLLLQQVLGGVSRGERSFLGQEIVPYVSTVARKVEAWRDRARQIAAFDAASKDKDKEEGDDDNGGGGAQSGRLRLVTMQLRRLLQLLVDAAYPGAPYGRVSLALSLLVPLWRPLSSCLSHPLDLVTHTHSLALSLTVHAYDDVRLDGTRLLNSTEGEREPAADDAADADSSLRPLPSDLPLLRALSSALVFWSSSLSLSWRFREAESGGFAIATMAAKGMAVWDEEAVGSSMTLQPRVLEQAPGLHLHLAASQADRLWAVAALAVARAERIIVTLSPSLSLPLDRAAAADPPPTLSASLPSSSLAPLYGQWMTLYKVLETVPRVCAASPSSSTSSSLAQLLGRIVALVDATLVVMQQKLSTATAGITTEDEDGDDGGNADATDDESGDGDGDGRASDAMLSSLAWLSTKGAAMVAGALVGATLEHDADRVRDGAVSAKAARVGASRPAVASATFPPPLPPSDRYLPVSPEHVRHLGDRLLSLLLSVRHRGALEQTALAFGRIVGAILGVARDRRRQDSPEGADTSCCLDEATLEAPRAWLDRCLASLQGTEVGQAPVAHTRRSAGLPYAILALCMADVAKKGTTVVHGGKGGVVEVGQVAEGEQDDRQSRMPGCLVARAHGTLSTVVRVGLGPDAPPQPHPTALPTVHALNVLRALHRESFLARTLAPTLPSSLSLSLTGYRSANWDERNSASLLFAAVLDRLAGSGSFSPSLFFSSSPQVLTDLLASASDAAGDEAAVFAVFTLVSRCTPDTTGPAATATPTAVAHGLTKLRRTINDALTNHRSHLVRAAAARASAAFVAPAATLRHLTRTARRALRLARDGSSPNTVHGLLLSVRAVIEGRFGRGVGEGSGADASLADAWRRTWNCRDFCRALRLLWPLVTDKQRNHAAAGAVLAELVHMRLQQTTEPLPRWGAKLLAVVEAQAARVLRRRGAGTNVYPASPLLNSWLSHVVTTARVRGGASIARLVAHESMDVRRAAATVALAQPTASLPVRDVALHFALAGLLRPSAVGPEFHEALAAQVGLAARLVGQLPASPLHSVTVWRTANMLVDGGPGDTPAAALGLLGQLALVLGPEQITAWLDRVEAWLDVDEDLVRREAAVRSLLLAAPAIVGAATTSASATDRARVWLALAQALNEDSDELRGETAATVDNLLPVVDSDTPTSQEVECLRRAGAADAALYDAAVRRALALHPVFQSDWATTRSLFEEEPANVWAEPVVTVAAMVSAAPTAAEPDTTLTADLTDLLAWLQTTLASEQQPWTLYNREVFEGLVVAAYRVWRAQRQAGLTTVGGPAADIAALLRVPDASTPSWKTVVTTDGAIIPVPLQRLWAWAVSGSSDPSPFLVGAWAPVGLHAA